MHCPQESSSEIVICPHGCALRTISFMLLMCYCLVGMLHARTSCSPLSLGVAVAYLCSCIHQELYVKSGTQSFCAF